MTESIISKYKSSGNLKLHISMRNGTFDDLSGNNNHGTATGTKITKTFHGFSGEFNSTNSYVAISHNSSLDLTTTGTIGGWICPRGNNNYDSIITKTYWDGSDYRGYNIYLTNGNARISIEPNNYNKQDVTQDLRDGKWHFVVGTWNTSEVKIYVDGDHRGTTDSCSITGSVSNTQDVNIGRRVHLPGLYFDGLINEVIVFNNELTATEISQLYSETSKLKYPTKKTSTSPMKLEKGPDKDSLGSGLVGWWPLETVSNGTTPDLSGNGNTGTLNGGPVIEQDSFGKSIYLHRIGSNQNVEVTSSSELNAGTGNFSYGCWFKSTEDGASVGNIIDKREGGPEYAGYSLRYENAIGAAVTTVDTSYLFYSPLSNYNDGQWHHAFVTLNRTGSIQLYMDGVLGSGGPMDSGDSTSASNNQNLGIGYRQRASDWHYGGKIKDVRIYNRELSANEVNQLYNQGKNVGFRGNYGVIDSTAAES